MRIAVLLCCEPRYFPNAAVSLTTHVISALQRQGHTVDAISGLWTTRMRPGTEPNRRIPSLSRDNTPRIRDYSEQLAIVRSLRPKLYCFHDKPIYDASWMTPYMRSGVTVYGAYCMFMSWWLGRQLILQAEAINGKPYDVVVRSRIDLLFSSDLLLPQPLHTIFVPGLLSAGPGAHHIFDSRIFCNDQFAVGPRDLMLQSMMIHEHYDIFCEQMKHFELMEHMLCWYLRHHLRCGFELFHLPYTLQR